MRLLGPILVMLWCSTAFAQQASSKVSSALYDKCLKEAIEDKATRKMGADTSYSCYGNSARSWYEALTGDKLVKDQNGLFVARYYGDSGYCAHQIEDSDRKPVSAYVCEIVKSGEN
jgi:hypothetical protein